MFWLRNKKNDFQLHTLIWGPVYYTPPCSIPVEKQVFSGILENGVDPDQMALLEIS